MQSETKLTDKERFMGYTVPRRGASDIFQGPLMASHLTSLRFTSFLDSLFLFLPLLFMSRYLNRESPRWKTSTVNHIPFSSPKAGVAFLCARYFLCFISRKSTPLSTLLRIRIRLTLTPFLFSSYHRILSVTTRDTVERKLRY